MKYSSLFLTMTLVALSAFSSVFAMERSSSSDDQSFRKLISGSEGYENYTATNPMDSLEVAPSDKRRTPKANPNQADLKNLYNKTGLQNNSNKKRK